MKEECIICKAPLEYLIEDTEMECAICHKKELSKTRCVNGHYVCNTCHMQGLDAILGVCLAETSKNPIEIMKKMMDLPFCHMHGPEHHIMVGAALITAYKNCGGKIELDKALEEMKKRGSRYPGGSCGFWGCCGAAVSVGMCVSIITETTPLSGKTWGLANMATARALDAIGRLGGPRCCKRDSFTAVIAAAGVFRESLGVELDMPQGIKCTFSAENKQCIKKACPYYCG